MTDEPGRGEAAVGPTTTGSPWASGSNEAPGHGVAGSTILVAGASSESGYAVSCALLAAGARVVAISSGRPGLDALRSRLPAVDGRQCDLSDSAAVAELADGIRSTYDRIDGLVHLVGGWRGGGGLPGQTDEDWAILDRSFATLRVTSREFYPDLLRSPAARLAIVSSTSVDHPAPGGANYASAKAAAETWVRAIAKGFASSGDAAAAVIFVVSALAGREPELAERVVDLWSSHPAQLNGSRIPLSH